MKLSNYDYGQIYWLALGSFCPKALEKKGVIDLRDVVDDPAEIEVNLTFFEKEPDLTEIDDKASALADLISDVEYGYPGAAVIIRPERYPAEFVSTLGHFLRFRGIVLYKLEAHKAAHGRRRTTLMLVEIR